METRDAIGLRDGLGQMESDEGSMKPLSDPSGNEVLKTPPGKPNQDFR